MTIRIPLTRLALALLLLVALPLASGCWMMAKRSDSMIGRDRDALFEQWGPPAGAKPDGRGGEVWLYVEESTNTSGGGLNLPPIEDLNRVLGEVGSGKLSGNSERWQPTVVKVTQRTHLFWIDKKGKIVKAQTIEP